MHRDVGDEHFVLVDPFTLDAVIDHHVAEGAGGRDARGTGLEQLLGALDVDLLADVLLHPHAGTTGPTAHALGAVAAGLDDLDTADRTDHVAGRQVHVVVATEVARVVVHEAVLERSIADVEASVVDQDLEQLAVVDDLVVPTELRILVGQRVEAVGALGDDLLDAHRVERLDVLHRQHLEDVLVARTSGRVAGAHLARAENGERDAGPVHQLREGLADLLVLVVERSGAADPVQVLGGQRVAAVEHLEALEVVGPVGTFALTHAPRVALVLHRPVGVAELGGEVTLHQ